MTFLMAANNGYRACRRDVIRDSFRQCVKGVSWRYGSVNGTRGVDSQKAVPVIHKNACPDRCAFHAVLAPLKRSFMVQPVVEDRSVQVVIGGECTWQSQRLMEADFSR